MGQGGFGITYLALDKNLNQHVAVKEYLPIELAVRERDQSVHPISEDRTEGFSWGLEKFIAEAQTLAQFKHPNIVRVQAVFEANNTAYMVMEYEQGESLQDILTRRKTLEEDELLSVLIPILGGLALVHEAGFIHRDIKPANTFIRKDGSPVLIDFGSARKALGEQTKTLTSLVSPGYAPFEQYFSTSDTQGPWTDIYGLGATLYRAVAGISPMDAVDRSRSIHEASKDNFVSAVEIGDGKYSARFLKAIDHALKFKPQERPQNLAAWEAEFGVTEDLAEIKRLENIEEQVTLPATEATVKPSSRLRPLTATLLITFIACVVAFYQDILKALIEPYWPETIKPELVKVKPSSEEIALIEKQTEENAVLLKQKSEVTTLLSLADEDFNAGRLIEPPGVNALEHYLKILQIDSDNSAAKSGKGRIFQYFLKSSQNLINEQRFDEADRALLKVDITEPDSREVRLARLRLDEAKTKVEQLALETERKRQQEEWNRKAQEEKRLAELENRHQQEVQRKMEEEKRKAEETRLADLEQQRQEEEVKRNAEEEEKRKYNLLISAAEADYTQRAGGTGGDHEFNSSCGTNMVLYGVEGYSGSFVTSVGAMCTEIDADGNWTTNRTNQPGSKTDAPFNKGTLTRRTCPSGWAISGFGGRAGQWLDQLYFECRKLSTYGEFIQEGLTQTLSQLGGNGGRPFSKIGCGGNKPARGIAGRSGWYVDHVYLQCAVPRVATD